MTIRISTIKRDFYLFCTAVFDIYGYTVTDTDTHADICILDNPSDEWILQANDKCNLLVVVSGFSKEMFALPPNCMFLLKPIDVFDLADKVVYKHRELLEKT